MSRVELSVWLLVVWSFTSRLGNVSAETQETYYFTEMDVRLDCPFLKGRQIIWLDVQEVIAINGSISNSDPKYYNFEISVEGNRSSLIIYRAEMEDDSIYKCQNPTGDSSSFWPHIQSPPALSVSVNGKIEDGEMIYVDENTEISLECNSTGADPPVSVFFAVDDKRLVLDESSMNNDTLTAYASSRLIVNRSHRELECIDFGQKNRIYERVFYLNVAYPPNCTLDVKDATEQFGTHFLCACDGNPEPTNYTFTADGKIIQESVSKVLLVDENLPHDVTNITCWSENGKPGTTTPAIYYFSNDDEKGWSSFAIAVIVIVLVILLVGIIGSVLHKKKAKKGGFEQVKLDPL